MVESSRKIEQRLKNMKNIYVKISELVDDLPDFISEKTKLTIKNTILGDSELKSLMDGIDAHRPPRIFIMGRTGIGKSSLINALCEAYVAGVSDTQSCTNGANSYPCKDKDGRVLLEILDTRGIAESCSLDEKTTAEDLIISQINEFSPDVALFVLGCTHRDDVNKDTEFLKKVSESYHDINKTVLPIVIVVNKCDEMAPSRIKEPSEYPEIKIRKIKEVAEHYKSIIMKYDIDGVKKVLPVSSLMDWMTEEGEEVDVNSISKMPQDDIDNLQIAFDGRYNIEILLNILEKAIPDVGAQMGLRMACRLDVVVHRIASQLTAIFASISSAVAATPIPLSDIYILTTMQTVLVMFIASLSGRDVSIDTAKEFMVSMGGIVSGGVSLRIIAQQTSKFANAIFFGAGSAVSAMIAYSGTKGIGVAATKYYLDGATIEEAKKKLKEFQLKE